MHPTSPSPEAVRSGGLDPESHVYEKLPTPTSIRVLLLAPGDEDDDICCYLSPCDLDEDGTSSCFGSSTSEEQPKEDHDTVDNLWDALQLDKLTIADGNFDDRAVRKPFQKYTALSYVWGSVENPACISINGRANSKITRNLHSALKCLRKPDQALSLWIDAICINQDDPEEKKIQIGLMRRVYRQAHSVVGYIPQQPEDVEPFMDLTKKILIAGKKCMDLVEKRASEPTENQDGGDQSEEEDDGAMSFKVKHVPLEPTGTCIEDYDIPPEDDPVWITWRRFFASPYFRRIWILQEFALAKSIYLHTGTWTMAFPTIATVMESVRKYSRMMNGQYLGRGENAELSRAALLGWRGMEQMSMERVIARAGVQNELFYKLLSAFDFDATDPRDKLFALLGLVTDAEYFEHLVSYKPTDTYNKVYISFAKALIEQGHIADILSMACRSPGSLQIPSWVPDWSAPPEVSKARIISLDRRYKSGGNGTISSKFLQDQLLVSGRIVSKIAFMTSPAQKSSRNADIAMRIQDTFEMVIPTLNELSGFIKQKPVEILKNFFYCLTMQLKTWETIHEDDEEKLEFLQDFRLWHILWARLMEYYRIENRADLKVTYGAFPEEDLAFLHRVMGNLARRRICVVSSGNSLGLVPDRAEVGDHIAIIEGAPVPFVLREAKESSAEGGQKYSIVGDAFVLNTMQGEFACEEDHKWSEIVLV